MALVAFCYILCWSWNQIYFFMFNLGYPADFASNFYHFTMVMMLTNSIVNPFIYTFQYVSFKQAAKQLFCKCLMKDVESSSHPASTSASMSTILWNITKLRVLKKYMMSWKSVANIRKSVECTKIYECFHRPWGPNYINYRSNVKLLVKVMYLFAIRVMEPTNYCVRVWLDSVDGLTFPCFKDVK